MKLRRARQYRRGRIEIIPMIDVMFFLVVTFMLASLSMQSLNALPVNLPKGTATRLAAKEPLTLTVTRESQIFIDKTPATLDTIGEHLGTMMRGREPSLVIAADDAAPEGIVVRAMLRARSAGVRHFLFAVKRDE